MKKFIYISCIISLSISVQKGNSQDCRWIDFNQNGVMDVYEDPYAQLDKRVNDLLSQMTVKEKMSLLNELAPAIPRLGVSKYYHGNEALHGVVRPGKFTVFPQAIGLASTWNPDLIHQVATSISDEARGRWNEMEQGKLQLDKFNDLLYPKSKNSFEYYSAYVFLTNEENKKYFKKYKVSDDKGNEVYKNNDFIKELINNYCNSFNSTYKQELLKEKKEKIIEYCKNEIDTLNRSKAMSITSINNSIYLYERDLKNAKDKLERKSAEFDKKINKLNSIMEYLNNAN